MTPLDARRYGEALSFIAGRKARQAAEDFSRELDQRQVDTMVDEARKWAESIPVGTGWEAHLP